MVRVFNPTKVADEVDEMAFTSLGDFNEGGAGVFWSNGGGGQSPWEMHPDCEELLQCLEGEIHIEVLPLDGSESEQFVLMPGDNLIVEKGCWHRQRIPVRSKEFYLTPGQTEHSNAEDPRK